MFSLDWSYVNGAPLSTGVFKLSPEDFHVNELFEHEFSGEGEHILLKVEKKGLTTEELAKSISRLINLPLKLISYAGLKDRQGITTQWIGIHSPGQEISGIESLKGAGWQVLEKTRHHKKIRPGFLTGNHFKIMLRDLTNLDDFFERLENIKIRGVPNYFGEQRFGRNANNLIKAEEMLVQGYKVNDRFLKGMYYSAARSWIFNKILSARVQDYSWNIALEGDVMQLSGTNSIFLLSEVNSEILKRIKEKDLSPASPMPGKKKALNQLNTLALINDVYDEWMPWIKGLEVHGLEESWRSNILHVQELEYSIENQDIELSFILPAGAYATTVLRELLNL